MQTVDIALPNSSLTFQALKVAPRPPEDVEREMMDYRERAKQTDDWREIPESWRVLAGDIEYTWHLNGDIFVVYPDGKKESYWAKPTLGWAVKHLDTDCTTCRPPFFQFHSDGSVTCRTFGLTYLWEAAAGEPPARIEGQRICGRYSKIHGLTDWHFENDGEWLADYFDEHTSCQNCGSCNCYDCYGCYCDEGYATSYNSDYDSYGDYRRGRCYSDSSHDCGCRGRCRC